jgi:hypothetical protein
MSKSEITDVVEQDANLEIKDANGQAYLGIRGTDGRSFGYIILSPDGLDKAIRELVALRVKFT